MADADPRPEPSSAPSPDFETALARLEALVAQMDGGDLTLAQSLDAYEQGVALAKVCQQQLEKAEQQVRVLQDSLLQPLNDAGEG